MERKIGEIFEYEGKKLRVEADKDSECKRCCLRELCPDINQKIIGECVNIHRQDKTSVVFVEVKDEQPQKQAEQPKELNLCKILKYCPIGTKFWSPLLGEVELSFIHSSSVSVRYYTGGIWDINSDGTMTLGSVTSPEIMLFPSREQRDWTKVKYEPKKEKFDPKTLKPFDRVISRNKYDEWTCTLFSHIGNKPNTRFIYVTCESVYEYCIPYNDETKHLVGTKDEAPEYYRYWED